MDGAPSVSVVMPVYNAEPYLAGAIRSILGQTWEDFEFIIIDNGSTDSSPQTIQSFTDSRIRVVTNRVNIAPPPALNQGLRLAEGKYVARMDADDVSLPDRLAMQLRFMEAHPSCAAVGTQAVHIDEAGRKLYTPWYPTIMDAIRWRLLFTSPLGHSSVMMRREAVLCVDGYNETLRHAADYDLWFRLLARGYQITNLREILAQIRVHKGSDGMTARQSPELLEEMVDVSEAHIRELLHINVAREQLRALMMLLRRAEPLAEPAGAIDLLRMISRASDTRSRPFYGLTILSIALSQRLPVTTRAWLAFCGIGALMMPRHGLGSYRFIWREWITSGRILERMRIEWRRSV